ncbi:MAG: hypothetical protein FJ347_05035 [Sphingomonadales bacterium]|nr:hypothetical protein [Sphingomonadales bacterium]
MKIKELKPYSRAYCMLGITLTSVFHFAAAQNSHTKIKPDKEWALITGNQIAVNENNRIYYRVDPQHPIGQRIINFEKPDSLDAHDSDFLRFHLNASEVFDMTKTVSGPDFYISKTEVSNLHYRTFIKNCIQQWMKQNRSELFEKCNEEAPEYIKAVYHWLKYEPENSIAGDTLIPTSWEELERKMNNLDCKRITYKGVPVFPNTYVWAVDFPYSYNEPMIHHYFSHPRYANYPVVGVSQEQVALYCEWYSNRNENGITYRLPTEQEWERAASVLSSKSSKKSSGSPVKNDYLRNSKGCYMANYYPVYGNFGIDGGLYSLPEKAYLPNDAGCYHMQGNVAEWTSSSISFETGETGYLIKGGAWNLPESACNIGSRCIFPKTEQRSYVGFRMVGVPNKN